MRRTVREFVFIVTMSFCVPGCAAGATFGNQADFLNTVGGANLTVIDFEGLVTPPDTSIVVTELDGVTFSTSGSDEILVTDGGVLTNAEQDRDLSIVFPDPVLAVAVDMEFLDLFDTTLGGDVVGQDGDGAEVFRLSRGPGSFFVGYVDTSQPIATLVLEPDAGGRSSVDSLQTAVVPEPCTFIGSLSGLAMLFWLPRLRLFPRAARSCSR